MRQLALAIMLLGAIALPVRAELVWPAPSGPSNAPFTWNLGQANSTFAHWDVFAAASYPGPFAPDVGAFGPASATLTEITGSAFVTGGGNIYSPGSVTDFTVTSPQHGLGAGFQTTVVLQIKSLGAEVDYPSITLSWLVGGTTQTRTVPDAFYFQEIQRVPLGGFGGFDVENIWAFGVPYSPGQFVVDFNAAGSSLSLGAVRIDTMMTPIPEPSALLLTFAACGLMWRRK